MSGADGGADEGSGGVKGPKEPWDTGGAGDPVRDKPKTRRTRSRFRFSAGSIIYDGRENSRATAVWWIKDVFECEVVKIPLIVPAPTQLTFAKGNPRLQAGAWPAQRTDFHSIEFKPVLKRAHYLAYLLHT